ncbi:inorganic phosphate transporter [Nonomuraea terrae]|uniref:Inorganic phosphate transporter n=1 Tax=Nonomuraea terrae TaxID=2530383 RepID=A0A4R4XUS7_9ACTN|nr:inorganic phosphate transporter [Nonomuraea terrae]TDD35113.1 inorganic phosphate transporter [Nonomuraea terrae]
MIVEVAVAAAFAVVAGVNDGGALLATGHKLPTVRPALGLAALVAANALVPLLTHEVAGTFVRRLAGPADPGTTTVAVIAALAVVLTLTHHGRPTSLTLAVVGALAGAALGRGTPVDPGALALVLAVGLAAPFAGALAAPAVSRLLTLVTTGRGLRHWHWAGFGLQCLAYAANDGQKMLAVFTLALGVQGAPPAVTLPAAVLFGAGALYGMPRAGRTLAREIIASRPLHNVAAELGSGVTVVGCAAAGMPVSMTQSVAGGLIGTGLAGGGGRVRWHAAVRIALAWLLTLPASAAVAGAATFALTAAAP